MSQFLSIAAAAGLMCMSFASSAQSSELKEQMATVINLNGQLCAKVVSITRAEGKNMYNVECIRYRDGTGKATYLVDALSGKVK
jgi:hypothetical protein